MLSSHLVIISARNTKLYISSSSVLPHRLTGCKKTRLRRALVEHSCPGLLPQEGREHSRGLERWPAAPRQEVSTRTIRRRYACPEVPTSCLFAHDFPSPNGHRRAAPPSHGSVSCVNHHTLFPRGGHCGWCDADGERLSRCDRA